MKKITIISYTYPPSNAPAAQRPYALAKYLDKRKYALRVITCANQDSSLGFDTSFDPHLDNVELIAIAGINTGGQRPVATKGPEGKAGVKTKIKSFLIKVLSLFIFPDRGIFWAPFAMWYILKNRKHLQAEIIFSTSPLFSNHLVARFLKRYNPGAIHISDFRDFHYTLHRDDKKSFINSLHKRIEAHIIRKSDRVTFVSEFMKNTYAMKFPLHSSKFSTIYNGFEPEEFPIAGSLKKDKLTIFYAGSFYGGVRSPKPLLLALDEILRSGRFNKENLVIEIAGNVDNTLLEEVADLEVFNCINFLGLIPRREALQKFCEAHLLWLIIGNDINHYGTIPIKFFEYLAAKRNILSFAPKEAEVYGLIESNKLGWNLGSLPSDHAHNVHSLTRIIDLYENGKLDAPLDAIAINKFHKRDQIANFEKLF